MSLNAAALQLMAEKGLSLQDAAEIAAAMEARSPAAVRQKRYRDKQRNERDVTRDVTPPPIEDILTPPVDSPIEAEASNPRSKFPPPPGVTDAQWSDFLTVRRTKRAGRMTETGYSRLCCKLNKLAEDGWPPGEMIGLAVERGWTSVFAPKDTANGSHPDPTSEALNRILGQC